jgi:hypothetical protein
MATQPIDRQRMKHSSKTDRKTQPQLINRTNKKILKELVKGSTTDPRLLHWW